MSREIKFRCWNAFSGVMHGWEEMVEKNKIHLLSNSNTAYVCEQFTGLTDRNGVEIYENDRLKCDGYVGTVVYDEDEPRFAIMPDDSDYSLTLIKYEMMSFEVIGNIHQQ